MKVKQSSARVMMLQISSQPQEANSKSTHEIKIDQFSNRVSNLPKTSGQFIVQMTRFQANNRTITRALEKKKVYGFK